ncbi:MAG: homocysteine S-methyltransferase [Bacillus sp. (in: firmicutes)]
MSNPIEKIIEQFNLVILDGAMATEIEKKGVNIKNSLWSAKAVIDNPNSIKQVHADYFEAGADIATTNTYQASIKGFVQEGWAKEEAENLIRATVALAKEARDEFLENRVELDNLNNKERPFPLVAGSVGPYGAYLANGAEYTGNYHLTEEEWKEFHLPRMQLMKEAGVDLFAFETIPNFEEGKVLADLLAAHFPNDYAWLSFSVADQGHISDGTPLKEAVAYFNAYANICGIGVNCTAASHISAIIPILREATSKPIVIYPNAGGTYDAETKSWTSEQEENHYGQQAKKWHNDGAKLIGGCCQTNPGHINQIFKWARGFDTRCKS